MARYKAKREKKRGSEKVFKQTRVNGTLQFSARVSFTLSNIMKAVSEKVFKQTRVNGTLQFSARVSFTLSNIMKAVTVMAPIILLFLFNDMQKPVLTLPPNKIHKCSYR